MRCQAAGLLWLSAAPKHSNPPATQKSTKASRRIHTVVVRHPPRSSGASVQQIGGGLRVLKLMQYQGSQPLWSSDMLEVMFGMATHAGGHVWHGNT